MKPVLIIDDSATMREIISRECQALGFTKLVETTTGAAGLKNLTAFGNNVYSMVIFNCYLPDISITDMVKSIREVEAEVPILVVATIPSATRVTILSRSVGADAVITQPFTVEELKEKLIGIGVIVTDGTD